jgi:hypothetical protein
MTMWSYMTHSCGIGPRLLSAMMWYSFHHALMRLLWMRSMVDCQGEVTFASGIQDLPCCMRFIDGTLVETHKLWNNVMHRTWFNGEKKPFDEQHDHGWQPRSLHLHQHWIPKVMSWCNHIVAFQSLCQLA